MNHSKKLVIGAAMLLAFVVITGCYNPASPPEGSSEFGRVTLTIGGAPRTALPSITQFAKITLSFTGKDGAANLSDVDISSGTAEIELFVPGSWEVSARAHIDGDSEEPDAVSEPKTISWAGPGTAATVDGETWFTLNPTAEATEPGILKHTVTVPQGITLGSGSRIRIEQNGAVLEYLDSEGFDDGAKDIAASIEAANLSLNPGRYIVDILLVNDDNTVAVYREAAVILPGLITDIVFAPAQADFLDAATAASKTTLEGLTFASTDDDSSTVVFTNDGSPSLAVTAASTAQIAFFAIAKSEGQELIVSGADAENVIRVESGEEAGGSTASDTLAVFVVTNLDGGDKSFAITASEPGTSGSVTVDVTATREAAAAPGFGLFSKAATAEESAYERISLVSDTLDTALIYLANTSNVTTNTHYLITIDADQDIAFWSSTSNKANVQITLRGINMVDGENWKVSWDGTSTNGTTGKQDNGLIKVMNGITLILEDGITLDGKDTVLPGPANSPVAMVNVYTKDANSTLPSQFIMRDGSKIINAKSEATTNLSGAGAAVNINAQTASKTKSFFIMEGGEISDNICQLGSVGVSSGSFTMTGGKITGNSSPIRNAAISVYMGYAVYISGTYASFLLQNGEIGNNSRGVYANGAFTMEGGKITGNGTGLYDLEGVGTGLSVHGPGVVTPSTTISKFIITGGEISGNGSANSLGRAVYASRFFSINETVAIDGDITLGQLQYLLLGNEFYNTATNNPIIINLVGSNAQSGFDDNWKDGSVILSAMPEATINHDLVNKFSLGNGYIVNSTFIGVTPAENFDLDKFYIKEDGKLGLKE
jgi:hypothetical protein